MNELDLVIEKAINSSKKGSYGQIVRYNLTLPSLFKDKEERAKIEAHLKSGESKYCLRLYGSSLGQFYAIGDNLKAN